MTPPANQTAALIERLEAHLTRLDEGQGDIRERLSRIEALSQADATERAAIARLSQEAISKLQSGSVSVDRYEADQRTAAEQRTDLGRRIENLEGANQWLWRTIGGIILLAVLGALLVQAGLPK